MAWFPSRLVVVFLPDSAVPDRRCIRGCGSLHAVIMRIKCAFYGVVEERCQARCGQRSGSHLPELHLEPTVAAEFVLLFLFDLPIRTSRRAVRASAKSLERGNREPS